MTIWTDAQPGRLDMTKLTVQQVREFPQSGVIETTDYGATWTLTRLGELMNEGRSYHEACRAMGQKVDAPPVSFTEFTKRMAAKGVDVSKPYLDGNKVRRVEFALDGETHKIDRWQTGVILERVSA